MSAHLRSALLLSLWLGGCALSPVSEHSADQSLGQGALTSVAFSGRIAVRQNDSGDSGRIEWQGDTTQQHIELLSPLGNTVATLDHSLQAVHLVLADHQEFVAADAQQLTEKILGYALPLEGLPWWILGQAAPPETASMQRNEKGEPLTLTQAGWRMEYGDWRVVGDQKLPGLLVLQRDTLTIRLLMDRWTVQHATP